MTTQDKIVRAKLSRLELAEYFPTPLCDPGLRKCRECSASGQKALRSISSIAWLPCW